MVMLRYLAVAVAGCAALGAQPQMTCRTVDTPVPAVRAEGLAEPLGDVLIACTGGSPAAAGTAVPQFQILVIGNTPFNLRMVPPPKPGPGLPVSLPPTTKLTDALALLDEAPAGGQRACVPAAPSGYCPVNAGASNSPNVFQGTLLQENIVLFTKVPIAPPGEGKTRFVRITNLRANARKIPKQPDPDQITLTTQIFDQRGQSVPLSNPAQVGAVARPGYRFSVRTAGNGDVHPSGPALTLTPAMLPHDNPGPDQAFLVHFTEGFASSFKRRNLGTTGADPAFLVSQADPGSSSNTESGFYNSGFPSDNSLDTAGLADSGTRLKVVLTDIPFDVQVWVSARDVQAGATSYSKESPRALLTYAGANGDGPFNKNHPGMQDFSLFIPQDGLVTLVWEVVAADPLAVEDISFEIRLLAPNGVPRTGTALVNGSLAPVQAGSSETAHFPSFIESPDDPVPAFRIVPSLSVSPLTSISGASFSGSSVAPESVVAAFGTALSPGTEVAAGTPVTNLGGVRVDVIDNTGVKRSAPLFMVSPNQINFLLNPGTAPGQAVVAVFQGTRNVATGYLRVAPVAPALFSAAGDGQGVAAGQAVTIAGNDGRTADLARFDAEQRTWQGVPLDVNAGSATFLSLYGTGIRGLTGLDNVTLTADGQPVPVTYAGPQGAPGLDQINAGPLPASLSGRGEVPLVLTVDGKSANPVTIWIK